MALFLVPAMARAQGNPENKGISDSAGDRVRGLGTPLGEIDVPADPQAGLPGAVEYRRLDTSRTARAAAASVDEDIEDEGGLIQESELGENEPDDEMPEAPLPPYRGVKPGIREHAAPYQRLLGKKNTYVTWIGYEPSIDRVFIQLSRPVEYTISKGSNGELVLDLHGARIGASNDTRPLDLAHFDTVVSRVWAKATKGGNTRLFIELKEHTSYRLERKGRYIYVYFRG